MTISKLAEKSSNVIFIAVAFYFFKNEQSDFKR